MNFDVLPGPSLPERARTALARAATATVSDPRLAGTPAAARQVPVRSTRDGSPLLLPATGTLLAVWLAGGPSTVRVSLPAGPPFSALRLTGTARPVAGAGDAGITASTVSTVSIDSVEFTGASQARVPVEEYRAAAPDPLWRVAPGVLRHLEDGHMGDLVRCVRAHGMSRAEWVVPRGLDRYGLELLVLTTDGIASSGCPSRTGLSPALTTCRYRCAPLSPAGAGRNRATIRSQAAAAGSGRTRARRLRRRRQNRSPMAAVSGKAARNRGQPRRLAISARAAATSSSLVLA